MDIEQADGVEVSLSEKLETVEASVIMNVRYKGVDSRKGELRVL